MEEAGYTCWSLVLGAWSVGASHRRNRTWILCHAHSDDGLGDGVADRWSLLQAEVGALAQANEEGRHRFDELVPRDGMPEPDAYARIVRASNGIPNRVDRLRALGNSVVPQIPMLIGQFVRAYEEAKEKSAADRAVVVPALIDSDVPVSGVIQNRIED
jgi:DNA (cytosine-5)-methyltransferase 1